MTAKHNAPAQAGTPPARERLLLAALKLFALQGYAKTSIRAIAAEAHTNVAAVSYYFGDKAALYKALFNGHFGDVQSLIPVFTQPGLSLREALHSYFEGILTVLAEGEISRLYCRLHMREMLEPTSQWELEVEKDVRQPHNAMAALLCHHLGVAEVDDNIHRLTISISGLAHNLFSFQELVVHLAPGILGTSEAVAQWIERMTEYALAMVSAEKRLREQQPQATAPVAASPSAAPARRRQRNTSS